jgi:predicted methyltransferase
MASGVARDATIAFLRRSWLLGACLLAFLALSLHGTAAGDETSVRPGVNERYLAPDLDVDHWVAVFEGESREIFRSRGPIVGALGLEPGARVADIGAGTGLFLGPFSQAVGPGGRVYAVDISSGFVDHLQERAAQEGLTQVEVVKSSARSAELTEATVDLAFLCDVYHHFEFPKSMLASLHRALRPGGQLVLIDFERIPGKSRDWILEHVRADKAAFRAEIVAAGFVLEEEVKIEGLSENYALRFRRP